MKKNVFVILTVLVFSFIGNAQDSLYQSRKPDVKEIELIKDYCSKLYLQDQKFDFDNINIISQKENPDTELIVVNNMGFRIENISNRAILISYVNKNIINIFFIETINHINSKKEFAYYDSNNILLFSACFDSDNQLISSNFILNKNKGCGQAVANCIGDVYTHHGWLSVWAWVQSAFIPETVAAFAIACSAHECK